MDKRFFHCFLGGVLFVLGLKSPTSPSGASAKEGPQEDNTHLHGLHRTWWRYSGFKFGRFRWAGQVHFRASAAFVDVLIIFR